MKYVFQLVRGMQRTQLFPHMSLVTNLNKKQTKILIIEYFSLRYDGTKLWTWNFFREKKELG